jgi:tetratricopeptide (TPR) repeat protein
MVRKITAIFISIVKVGLLAGATQVFLGSGGLIPGASGLSLAFWSVPLFVFAGLLLASDLVRILRHDPWAPAVSLLLFRLGFAQLAFSALNGLEALANEMVSKPGYEAAGQALKPYFGHIARLSLWAAALITLQGAYVAARHFLAKVTPLHVPDQQLYVPQDLARSIARSGLLASLAFLFFHPLGLVSLWVGLDLGYLQMPVYLFALGRLLSDVVATFGRGLWRYQVAIALSGISWAVLAYVGLSSLPMLVERLSAQPALSIAATRLMPYAMHTSLLGIWLMALILAVSVYRMLQPYVTLHLEPPQWPVIASPVRTLIINNILSALTYLLFHPNGYVGIDSGLDLGLFQIPLYAFCGLRLAGDMAGFFGRALWRYAAQRSLHGAAWALLTVFSLLDIPYFIDALSNNPYFGSVGRFLDPYLRLLTPLAYWLTGYIALVTVFYASVVYRNRPQLSWAYTRLPANEWWVAQRLNRSFLLALTTYLLFNPPGLLGIWFNLRLPFVALPIYLLIGMLLTSNLFKMLGTGRWRFGLFAVISDRQLAKALRRELESLDRVAFAEFEEDVGTLQGLLKDPARAEEAEQRLSSLKEAYARGEGRLRRARHVHREALEAQRRGEEFLRHQQFNEAEGVLKGVLDRLARANQDLDHSDTELEKAIANNVQEVHRSLLHCHIGRGTARMEQARSSHRQNRHQEALRGFEEVLPLLRLARQYATEHNLQEEGQHVQDLIQQAEGELEQCREALKEPVPLPIAVPLPVGVLHERYELMRALGGGGQADVYEARRRSDGLRVAIKVPRGVAGGVLTLNSAAYNELEQEADVWKKLEHPNIVRLLEVGLQPFPWLVMEYMENGSLRERLGRPDRIPLKEALAIAIAVCKAVEYAHHAGVRCHRDLKPDNILFNADRVAKVADWGMARNFLSLSLGQGYQGTIDYSAPEQLDRAQFGEIGHHTDVFALGITLYEMFTGRHPFRAPEEVNAGPFIAIERIKDSSYGVPPPSQFNPNLPSNLDPVLLRALMRRRVRGERYGEMLLLREDLEALQEELG